MANAATVNAANFWRSKAKPFKVSPFSR
jgi:hypothetical protein